MGDRDLEIDGLIDEHRVLMTIMAALRRAAASPTLMSTGCWAS